MNFHGIYPLLAAALAATPGLAAERLELRTEPHSYLGDRGSEPTLQNVMSVEHHLGGEAWEIVWHLEAESLGRRDSSLDLDRAWIRTGPVTLGRVHPWDVSGNPEVDRPWGYLAQAQPQNRGVLLGRPNPGGAFPKPTVSGWLGAHYFSDTEKTAPLAWGVSATPIFVPSLGSEVALSESAEASAGRFGRRPPGSAEVNGVQLPLRYRVDRSHLVQDVILQPQLAAQLVWREPLAGGKLKGWATVMRAPVPDPAPEISGFLRVSTSGVDTVAEVLPKFPERWLGSINQEWSAGYFSLFHSLELQQGGVFGYEFGARLGGFRASYLNETGSTAAVSTNQPNAERYSTHLVQLESEVGLGVFTVHGGLKQHLDPQGAWLRAGAAFSPFGNATIDAGFEAFGGGDDSYFGEWRTDDRIYLGFTWRVG